jgi:hypothetical protein
LNTLGSSIAPDSRRSPGSVNRPLRGDRRT